MAREDASEPDLIGRIYAALHGAAGWGDFLAASRQLLPNSHAILFHHDSRSSSGAATVTSGFDPGYIDEFNSHYVNINPWMDHVGRRVLHQVTVADDLMPREELKRTEFYNDFLRRYDIETGIGVTLTRNDHTSFFLSILCADADTEMQRAAAALEAAVPHLMRAYDYVQRQAAAPMQASTGQVRLGAGMKISKVDEGSCQIIAAADGLTIGPFGRLHCADPRVEQFVSVTLAAWPDIPHPSILRLYLRQAAGRLPLRLELYCPGFSGMNFFTRPEVLVLIEDPNLNLPAAIAEFGRIYRLSMAETAIVDGLAHGLTLEEIAAARRSSRHTVRAQMKSILAKSGCRGQADVMRHLGLMVGNL